MEEGSPTLRSPETAEVPAYLFLLEDFVAGLEEREWEAQEVDFKAWLSEKMSLWLKEMDNYSPGGLTREEAFCLLLPLGAAFVTFSQLDPVWLNNKHGYCIEGPLGIGKTTAIDRLLNEMAGALQIGEGTVLQIIPLLEDPAKNPWVHMSIGMISAVEAGRISEKLANLVQKAAAPRTQLCYRIAKIVDLVNALAQAGPNPAILLFDRAFWVGDKLFIDYHTREENISARELRLLDRIEGLFEDIIPSHMLCVLHADEGTLVARTVGRGRTFERGLTQRLAEMQEETLEFLRSLSGQTGCPIEVIDTSKLPPQEVAQKLKDVIATDLSRKFVP